MTNLKSLGKEIKKKRLNENLTLERVACVANISKPTLIEIEKGNPKCEIGNYFAVMDVLKIDFKLSNLSKNPKRQRATRRNSKQQKRINSFIIATIENYADHINESSDKAYELLENNGLLASFYDDYEDMHGFGFEYINNYLDEFLKGGKGS